MATQDLSTPLDEVLTAERRARINSVLGNRTRDLVLVLDRVSNAHNISAVMRSADAFGIQDIHIIGDRLEFSDQISLGSERWATIKTYLDEQSLINELAAQGYKLAVLAAPEPSRQENPGSSISLPVWELPFSEKLALVFGNEHHGVSAPLLGAATYFAHIPMCGFAESFNISVAAALTMFCSILPSTPKPPRLTVEEQLRLKELWIEKTTRGGAEMAARLRDK